VSDPYYQDEHVTLYHGDCLEHPEWWVRADVLVTDPPYGIDYKAGRMTGVTRADRLANSRLMAEQGTQRIKSDKDVSARDWALSAWGERPALVFGHWRKPRPERTVMRLLWVKTAPGTLLASAEKSPWITQDEEIYALADTASEFTNGRVDSNILVDPNPCLRLNAQRGGHPTAKPIGLMQWLLKKCKPEWVVADPFAGSGSTLVAAKRLGRHAVGVELEERYCEIAARRLSQGVLDFGEWSA
jgi:site-specific DNA-methyltransferase (adenine-specific)